VAAVLATLFGVASGSANLVAPYLLYYVTPGNDFDVLLKGFVSQTSPKKFNFETLDTVSNGALYLPSYNYCKYGHQPSKRGSDVAGPATITCHSPSLLYNFPSNQVLPRGELDRFSYVVQSATHGRSCPGVVNFVDSSDPLLVASEFLTSADGWSVEGNCASSRAVWDPTSSGPLMNRYVHGTECSIDLDAGRTDKMLWFFQAPSKFLGNGIKGGMAMAYRGTLRFTLSSASGDFSNLNSGHDGTSGSLPVVRIECETCRNEGITPPSCEDTGRPRPVRRDRGITLVFPFESLSHSFISTTMGTMEVSISLDETQWLKDSENSQVSWCNPTQNEFIQVLKRFSRLSILGDYTRQHETVLLDTVRLEPPLHAKGSVLPESAHAFMHFEDQC